MCMCTRRALLVLAGGVLVSADANSGEAAGSSDADRAFVAEAQRMRAVAIADGDQPFGAITFVAGQSSGTVPAGSLSIGTPTLTPSAWRYGMRNAGWGRKLSLAPSCTRLRGRARHAKA